MIPFVHLHVHSYYSILDGQASIKGLVDKARANGMRGMALTDHGNMFGIKEFFDYTNKVNGEAKGKIKGLKQQLKEAQNVDSPDQGQIESLKQQLDEARRSLFIPIFGCEVYVAEKTLNDHVDRRDTGRHLILLAKNEKGYHNLLKIVSKAWTDGFYSHPRTDHDELKKYHEGIICSSACLGGEIPQYIMNGQIEKAKEAARWFKDVFGDDYYLELQRHKATVAKANHETYPRQQEVNKVLIEMSKELGIKLICTNDSHFINEDDAEAHDHLLCLATGKDLDDPKRMLYSKQEWFKTQEEMNEVFADVPEALANTQEIVDKIEFYNIEHDPIMPFFPIPESFGKEEEWRKKFSEEDLYKEFCSDENGENLMSPQDAQKRIDHLGGYDKIYRIKFEADYLSYLAYEGAKKQYGDPVPDDVKDRINFELHVMKTMGFPGYFLIVQDFINSARDKLGVMVGPGRGSAAGSVVAYCLGITKIDPLKYDLLFERFLNPDRISLPDIDTDFDDEGRGRVLQWVMDKYGHENCAHIITYSTMATKNSIKDVARVEKVPLDTVNALCKAIPDKFNDGAKMNLSNAIERVKELQDAANSTDTHLRNTIKYAKKLEGTVRGTGIHACGFIICRDRIDDHVPVSTADDPDFKGVKVPVTQYDGHVIESTGLIKMDFLGLSTLSELKEAVKNVKETTGKEIDLDNIPIDDPLTYKLFQEGRTVGTFQFESAGMQKYLRELHPEVFGDLIAMNALYRPGPIENIPHFIARKLGKEPITYPIPEMEKYLKDTYGITVYQEQVMLLSRLLAGFTRGQSDTLRKAMGKKKIEQMNKLEVLFYKGGEARGHDHDTLNKIWEEWKKFASYAFNKSHAACYSWVAFQTAYLKAHYPAEYMAALLTRRSSDIKEVTKLMDECKNCKVATLGPDVNESFAQFGVNQKGQIRFGLAAIKGLGVKAAESIIKERKQNGPYKDIFDFAQRTDYSSVNRKAFESLAYSGGFDSFGIPRESFFATDANDVAFLDTLVRYGQKYQNDKSLNQNSLFGDSNAVEIATPEIPKAEPWSDIERLNKEKEMVGIYLSAHPLDKYYMEIQFGCNTSLNKLDDKKLTLNEDITFGGIVTDYVEKRTRNDRMYGRITLEDYSGKYELMLFGRNFVDFRNFGIPGEAIMVRGVYNKSPYNDRINFDIKEIKLMDDVKGKLVNRIRIAVDDDQLSSLSQLKLCMNDSTTNRCDVYFRIHDKAIDRVVDLKSRFKMPLNKDVIDTLNDMEINYEVNF
ncbi:DNA polymerase III subunit alpha [Sodaliphilus pleomorphus]|uniref:DNA polymerase III subunit alpha n=1 Tax=Sodaliphilus pleomorphus TaxID=2606626 RepID=A0A6L5XBH7_9BACT|nr:DNA polymerase III subunit alpha [Sodaliphilus pleomorphus]MSS17809.1 DNA polymerase III subunit alpha [Sodaliphilus pleomorphus]